MSQDPYDGVPLPDDEPAPDETTPPFDDEGPGSGPGTPPDRRPVEDGPAGVDADGVLPSPEELLLEHDGRIGVLRTDVNELAGVVADLLANPPKGKPAPWNWKHLNGSAAAKLLTELREWVDWYNDRYGVAADSRIPGCWYRHAPVVEELTGVWVAWRAAYYGHTTPLDAPAYWHERILWPTFDRITKRQWGMVNCINGHKDPRPQQTPSTDNGFDEFLNTLEQEE
ncbi:hypothetical protein [Arthrobacter bambusae]|uniref:hypothetical protein n=1 Tax=Arthrobacter bambusae TaxID=1338426 RepID=UPI00277EA906|nr:hypothetical protein [Arthrobacter bambusae]MDQ0212149.1 hypothetical protein [Arthrobacter bambusae]MDQ0236633.1 hypothetical protein [Arthrobacter bambusae]